ncbi:UNVERIFIED_CONTAM: hypothetical protein HDU68_007116 [Siphonaria sp. JEL0065]|nr:hypothetical protein HDU68_007116 [Siphonaria sp. JEL0065]
MIMSVPDVDNQLDAVRSKLAAVSVEFSPKDLATLRRGFALSSAIDSPQLDLLQTITDHVIKTPFSDASLKQSVILESIAFFLDSYSAKSMDNIMTVSYLKLLSSFLGDVGGGSTLQSFHDRLVTLLTPFSRYPLTQKPMTLCYQIRKWGTSCLVNLCVKLGSTNPKFNAIQEGVVSILIENLNVSSSMGIVGNGEGSGGGSRSVLEAQDKLVVTAMRGIQTLLAENKGLFVRPLAGIVVKLHSLIFTSSVFGDGVSSNSTTTGAVRGASASRRRSAGNSTSDSWRRSPSVGTTTNPNLGKSGGAATSSIGGGGRSTSRQERLGGESDSEVSDSDWANASERYSAEKVKLNALYCLQNLSKSHPKPIYAKWSLFLASPQNTQQQSLFSIMNQPNCNPKLRIAASLVLQSFLEGSQQYLAVAEDSRKTAPTSHSYTSLSQKLASMVCDLHTGLLGLIGNGSEMEKDTSVIQVHFKALGVLIKNSPYARIQSRDLRSEVFEAVCFGELDTSQLCPRLNLLTALLDAGYIIPDDSVKSQIMAWVYYPFSKTSTSEQLQIESLDTLCALIRNQFQWVHGDWTNEIEARVLSTCWTATSGILRVACVKVVEQFAESFSKLYTAATGAPDSDWWWSHVLKVYVEGGVCDSVYGVRAVSLQVLAHVPGAVFGGLDEGLQRFCREEVVRMFCGEADENVKSNCCLTLGLWVTLEYFMKDSGFLRALISHLPNFAYDKALLVRVRSSWAIANLADTLLSLQQQSDIATATTSPNLLESLIKCAIHSANDNEKCRSNGVRAIGNLLRLSSISKSCFSPALTSEIDAITKNITTGAFKVRWNACYAAYNLFQSPSLSNLDSIPTTQIALLIDALLTALSKSKNYKVRINAAIALSGPVTLKMYCGKEEEVVEGLKRASETVDDLEETDFGEFKYRKGLLEQVGKSWKHLELLQVVGFSE